MIECDAASRSISDKFIFLKEWAIKFQKYICVYCQMPLLSIKISANIAFFQLVIWQIVEDHSFFSIPLHPCFKNVTAQKLEILVMAVILVGFHVSSNNIDYQIVHWKFIHQIAVVFVRWPSTLPQPGKIFAFSEKWGFLSYVSNGAICSVSFFFLTYTTFII